MQYAASIYGIANTLSVEALTTLATRGTFTIPTAVIT